MQTTTNSIAAYEASMPARGRFGIKNVTSGRCQNFKPNRPLAGMESAQSAIEFVVFREEFQANASLAVALDVDGDGLISTTTLTASQVSFNWDGLNFKKKTGWINANDAFLVLDRDFNQSVDNDTELLSNPLVFYTASSLRIAPSWRSTANRCRCEGLKLWQTKLAGTESDIRHPADHYESNSTPRRFYAGEVAETLEKPTANDSN